MDLVLWEGPGLSDEPYWPLGRVYRCPYEPGAAHRLAGELVQGEDRDLLFWDSALGAPEPERVRALCGTGDVVHAGLKVGTRGLPEETDYCQGEWSLVDPAEETRGNSWRVSLRCCLVSTGVLRTLGDVDPAFQSLDAAALEAGLRWLRQGAVVWYDPALLPSPATGPEPSLPLRDRYLFLFRTYKGHWARLVLLRRSMAGGWAPRERAAFREASSTAAASSPAAAATWEQPHSADEEAVLAGARISVIVPTLGRYPYLPEALDSLRRQTVRPVEVICVDQNPPEQRQPEVYEPFQDLNLRVIWQDQRGQSLARNTGLEATTGDYVFLFDDDSIASPDCIEQHLRMVVRYGAEASTGVAYPPPPEEYTLPENFRFVRVSQTFDTGNSLMTRRAIQAVGGLDRAYDRGNGTDTDMGTRLYLAGGLIIHNPHARRIHYKAPMGGLRTYGAWWMHSTRNWLAPFPQPTQLYYQARFLNPRQRLERLLQYIFMGMVQREVRRSRSLAGRARGGMQAVRFLALLPLRLARARSQANQLLAAGPQIPPSDPAVLSRGARHRRQAEPVNAEPAEPAETARSA